MFLNTFENFYDKKPADEMSGSGLLGALLSRKTRTTPIKGCKREEKTGFSSKDPALINEHTNALKESMGAF